MRKFVIFATTATLALAAATATAQGDSALDRRSYDVAGFTSLSMVGPHHVQVSVGQGYSVSAEGPRETLEHTDVLVENGRLKIQPKDDGWWREHDGEWRNYKAASFRVTVPQLESASLAGSGDVHVDRIEGGSFHGSVAGSGELDLAALRVGDAHFSIAGSGNVTARGVVRASNVSIAGSGDLRARDVTSGTASISIIGSGNAALTVNDDARVTIMGSGDADIAGNAQCRVTRMGSGNVTCGHITRE